MSSYNGVAAFGGYSGRHGIQWSFNLHVCRCYKYWSNWVHCVHCWELMGLKFGRHVDTTTPQLKHRATFISKQAMGDAMLVVYTEPVSFTFTEDTVEPGIKKKNKPVCLIGCWISQLWYSIMKLCIGIGKPCYTLAHLYKKKKKPE